ncbi:putative ABC transporter permease protein [Streptomyces sp. 769]|nr:putative ABC transporter permease protein [Streptomyces sp. 769]
MTSPMSAVEGAAVPAGRGGRGRGRRAGGGPSVAARLAARAGGGAVRVFLVLVALFWLMPSVGLLLSSLRGPAQIAESGWWQVFTRPAQLTFDNYGHLLSNGKVMGSLVTTAAITVPSTVLVVVIGSLAGYAFAWLEFPGRDAWFMVVVGLLVVPVQVALIPVAKLFGAVGLFETTAGVVLFHTAFGLPFAVFLLRNFFAEIPRELLEAARLDGAGELRLFTRVGDAARRAGDRVAGDLPVPVGVERHADRVDLRGQRASADHGGVAAGGAAVRQQHRCAGAGGVPVDGGAVGGLLRLPAAVRVGRDGGRGEVTSPGRPGGTPVGGRGRRGAVGRRVGAVRGR